MSANTTISNRKASFNFELLERFEAGMVLTGTEVKSLRAGKANLGDAYAVFKNDELWLLNFHISEYPPAAGVNHPPLRTRKLLLKRQQIERLIGQLKQKGLTLIPTKIFFNPRGIAKCEIALAKGKAKHDKRESIKKRESTRQMARAVRR